MTNQSDINIYLIQEKISNVLIAVKANTKSKLKLNSESADFNNNDENNDEIKKKRLIYKMIQMWHQCLDHLNVSNII